MPSSFDHKDFDKIENFWNKYEGDFNYEQKDGFGLLYLTNGEKYAGSFKNDQVHGYGTFYKKDGAIINGQWENNKFIKSL